MAFPTTVAQALWVKGPRWDSFRNTGVFSKNCFNCVLALPKTGQGPPSAENPRSQPPGPHYDSRKEQSFWQGKNSLGF